MKRIYLIPLLLLLGILTVSCASSTISSATSTTTTPARVTNDFTTCFYDFTDVYVKRIYNVLSSAPGASNVKRLDGGCEDGKDCICYELYYDRSIDELGEWLKENLRTSKALPFRLVQKGDNRLEAYFHGGFE